MIMGGNSRFNQDNGTLEICFDKSYFQVNTSVLYVYEQFAFMYLGKEWTGKMIYFNFGSIFGDFFLKFFEEEVSDYLSWPDSYVLYVCAHNYAQNFHQGDCMQSSSKVVDSKFSI